MERDHRMKILHDLRNEYLSSPLELQNLAIDPYQQFLTWFEQAETAKIPEVNAFCFSTYDEISKRVSSRILLLKEVLANGFVFYTNYESPKAMSLEKNGHCSLNFYWQPLYRQIRIEGIAAKISAAESDKYFKSRPRNSQISAIISPQGKVVASRQYLEEKFNSYQDQHINQELQRPAYWGGYVVQAYRFEFWQGRVNRLHDRFLYERNEESNPKKNLTDQQVSWNISRIAP